MIRDFNQFSCILNLDNYELKEIISIGPNYNVFKVIHKKSKEVYALRIVKVIEEEELIYKIIYNNKLNQFLSVIKIFEFQDNIPKRNIPEILIENLENNDSDHQKTRYFFITEEYMDNGDIDHLLYQYLKTKGKANFFSSFPQFCK